MPPLHDTLEAMANRPDTVGAMVLSDEGLVIDSALAIPVEEELVAALAATAARSIRGLTEAIAQGQPEQIVIESSLGTLLLTPLTASATLLVIAENDSDLGDLLYDLRRHAPALAELV
jgi:predicted regulator of Ras-like GTPase activity (Roadblock/LC7/MglB family)